MCSMPLNRPVEPICWRNSSNPPFRISSDNALPQAPNTAPSSRYGMRMNHLVAPINRKISTSSRRENSVSLMVLPIIVTAAVERIAPTPMAISSIYRMSPANASIHSWL